MEACHGGSFQLCNVPVITSNHTLALKIKQRRLVVGDPGYFNDVIVAINLINLLLIDVF